MSMKPNASTIFLLNKNILLNYLFSFRFFCFNGILLSVLVMLTATVVTLLGTLVGFETKHTFETLHAENQRSCILMRQQVWTEMNPVPYHSYRG